MHSPDKSLFVLNKGAVDAWGCGRDVGRTG